MADAPSLEQRVKELIVRQLRLKTAPEDIEDTAPLFGGALGLDSIDALELVVGLEKEFGQTITDQAQVIGLVDFYRRYPLFVGYLDDPFECIAQVIPDDLHIALPCGCVRCLDDLADLLLGNLFGCTRAERQ